MNFEKTHPVLTQKVRDLTKMYHDLFPEEYEAVKEIAKQKREELRSATGGGQDTHALERPLIEFPENLWTAIYNRLSDEEMVEFNTKEGMRWFARTYPGFRIPEKI